MRGNTEIDIDLGDGYLLVVHGGRQQRYTLWYIWDRGKAVLGFFDAEVAARSNMESHRAIQRFAAGS